MMIPDRALIAKEKAGNSGYLFHRGLPPEPILEGGTPPMRLLRRDFSPNWSLAIRFKHDFHCVSTPGHLEGLIRLGKGEVRADNLHQVEFL
jgi:hypothetical protein